MVDEAVEDTRTRADDIFYHFLRQVALHQRKHLKTTRNHSFHKPSI